MQESIVTQMDEDVTEMTPTASVERIYFRGKGRYHPEQYKALVNGRYVDVTPASARMVIDLARDYTDYKHNGLLRRDARDGGRKWWIYTFLPNEFAQHLVEVPQ